MFRTAEIGRSVDDAAFEEAAAPLRIELVELQQQLRSARFPVVILFGGVDGGGKSETINVINEWLDPRGIVARAYGPPSDEERERPEFWRYWRDLPGQGRIGLFLRSWYSRPILDHVYGHADTAAFNARLDRIRGFEKMLTDDGTLVLKFWMHLSREAQKHRFKMLSKDPHESWRVTSTDWQHYRMYDKFIAAAEQTIIRTSTGAAPWRIVEGVDSNYRVLTVMTAIRDAARHHLQRDEAVRAAQQAAAEKTDPPDDEARPPTLPPQPSVLSILDMTLTLGRKDYERRIAEQTARLHRLAHIAKERQISTILVLEGWDAAGKGGAIRRVIAALDARDYQVIPIAAPTDEEKAHHYLWRFWRHIARAGRVTIFDRSWYGRVLVERIEGYATQAEWRRAYAEINQFESELIDHGIVLVKFWMHITKDEQLRRFERRQAIPYKRWKLTEEDWRNREKWDDYEAAVNDMIGGTSTRQAPWTLVEGNSKRYARLKVLQTVCERLEQAIGDTAEDRPANVVEGPKRKAAGKH